MDKTANLNLIGHSVAGNKRLRASKQLPTLFASTGNTATLKITSNGETFITMIGIYLDKVADIKIPSETNARPNEKKQEEMLSELNESEETEGIGFTQKNLIKKRMRRRMQKCVCIYEKNRRIKKCTFKNEKAQEIVHGRATESQQERQRRGKHGLSVIRRFVPVTASETRRWQEKAVLHTLREEKRCSAATFSANTADRKCMVYYIPIHICWQAEKKKVKKGY